MVLLLAACNSVSAAGTPTAANARTYVYNCDKEYSFTVRVDANIAWLFLPDQTLQLTQGRSASGARYADNSTIFWTKGEQALLNHGGDEHRNCLNDKRAAVWQHAKLNGVDFRAVGNEPGWQMEISNKNHIMLLSDYGQSKYIFKNASIQSSATERKTVYAATNNTDSLRVTLVGERCQDTMADEQYETSVVIELNGRELRGCGKPLH